MVWKVMESVDYPGMAAAKDSDKAGEEAWWPNTLWTRAGYASFGAAVTMCDVLNARDYPDVAP